MKPSFAVVGSGRVGTALGKYLTAAGYKLVGLTCKSRSSAKRAASIIGVSSFLEVSWEISKHADIVFITTPDTVINDVCNEIALNNGFKKGTTVLHCSGALPSTVLLPAKTYGAATASMHPLQSFASVLCSKNPFKEIVFSVEGDKNALYMVQKIIKDLGATCLTMKTEGKTVYHAAAVAASNYLVTLQALALKLVALSGISEKDAFKILKPLINGTLLNIERSGIEKALTGPIARGDAETVRRHIKEIGLKSPDLLPLYKVFGFHTIDIAKSADMISDAAAKRLKEILG